MSTLTQLHYTGIEDGQLESVKLTCEQAQLDITRYNLKKLVITFRNVIYFEDFGATQGDDLCRWNIEGYGDILEEAICTYTESEEARSKMRKIFRLVELYTANIEKAMLSVVCNSVTIEHQDAE